MFEYIAENGSYRNLYRGEWAHGHSGAITVKAPADGTVLGTIPSLQKDEIDLYLQSARDAQKIWAAKPVNERARILRKAAQILDENADEIGGVLSEEISKGLSSAVGEVRRTADFIRFTADQGELAEGRSVGSENFPHFQKDKISVVTRVPLGVVLAISPFNYPINLAASKVAPALIAGNSVILKPPTSGAISGLHLAAAFKEAGLPDGVLTTVTGRGSEIGDYLVTHPLVDFINFTGSSAVGKHIAEIAGMVPLLMELGGKDAAIILRDADLDLAARLIVSGAYGYSGQRCTAVKRVLAEDDIADELAGKIVEQIGRLRVGQPRESADVTPLINTHAADYVQELIDDALAKGAKLLIGKKREGNLLYPTLFDHVTTDMRLAWEEPFGPVLPIIRIRDADEGIAISNRSEYGLQGAVFTKDINKAFYVASRLDVGTVQINGKPERGPDHFPFLGVKSSGMGTQGIRYSIEAMSRPKVIVINFQNS
ncbi:NADP-dependent glyceraldehyde-3-phosphate dehydrogenase [Ethanoligenens harbinense]|uniref:Aldehyde Dehydrogenase n=1 Tax=Ethanoligenens harbinense (strain DSM 18485 / JCM 12961 / CGMCC 1.5033 / YUAN-3) TaxID=663278 RepID=E6U9Y3_ETHHY|nr:NADP-dependent glyceraldehyde-3-phosphate dehydrogenase [Ethanoligenens harbinense]ADU26249.1 Aldehyde Dehydrogenase [Ethanoligenens harbinense YUAN-3]AVQ95385.1 NADP-dependent glyceraldehyde-3-phosphate dehydrogenase [Ethanoligenens harbinense YUAN-3]AYF38050.1 NADP-dependent glyceraldehyde-3-phosphate dehydrogenase [Ethanoligenens harbinense]AYF40795.1 NADP-dependent glyceraldehyde-3-phosphate dehydrogenase [Ethanoligenens harbinense]QCN91626.1 NADP-dependent glyceraldehyde-3-phosphate de